MKAKNSKENLCDTCKSHIAECHSIVKFGDGIGDDNIIECDVYEGKEDEIKSLEQSIKVLENDKEE